MFLLLFISSYILSYDNNHSLHFILPFYLLWNTLHIIVNYIFYIYDLFFHEEPVFYRHCTYLVIYITTHMRYACICMYVYELQYVANKISKSILCSEKSDTTNKFRTCFFILHRNLLYYRIYIFLNKSKL